MTKILVTGASGKLGKLMFEPLLKRNAARDIIAMVRDPAKAEDLAALGIEIRQGDYFDYGSLVHAFKGMDKVMLISAHGFTDRNTQHYNAITAARQAGVKHVVFMSIIRKDVSGFSMPEVTPSDIFAEQTLLASGLTYTIVRHPPFLDVVPFYIGNDAYEKGVRMPAGDGRWTAATRADLAEAQAVILSEPGHGNKIYALDGGEAVSFADLARILSDARNAPVAFIAVPDKEFTDSMNTQGMPDAVAKFLLGWIHGMTNGEWDGLSGDLEHLLGRKPTTVTQYFRDNYPMAILGF